MIDCRRRLVTFNGKPATRPVLHLSRQELLHTDADDVILQSELQCVEAQQLQPQLTQENVFPVVQGQAGLSGTEEEQVVRVEPGENRS